MRVNQLRGIGDNPASLDRPAWTSESGTGMFEAYKHKHTVTTDRTGVILNYYEVTYEKCRFRPKSM